MYVFYTEATLLTLLVAAGPHRQIFADLFSQSEWTLDSVLYGHDSIQQKPRARPPPLPPTPN